MSENIVREELDLDAKVTIRSIAPWTVGFSRKSEGSGDISLAPHGSARMSRNEIIAQVQNGNKLFIGTDGFGSHATIFIEDAPTRKELEFDNEDHKQNCFFNVSVKKLFAIKNQADFEGAFRDAIYTRAEKFAIIEAMKKDGVNDYSKIRFVEQYTGISYQ